MARRQESVNFRKRSPRPYGEHQILRSIIDNTGEARHGQQTARPSTPDISQEDLRPAPDYEKGSFLTCRFQQAGSDFFLLSRPQVLRCRIPRTWQGLRGSKVQSGCRGRYERRREIFRSYRFRIRKNLARIAQPCWVEDPLQITHHVELRGGIHEMHRLFFLQSHSVLSRDDSSGPDALSQNLHPSLQNPARFPFILGIKENQRVKIPVSSMS